MNAANIRRDSWTLPRVILPPIKHGSHVILHLCTSTGSIEHWAATQNPRKPECRHARKSGWGDLWVLRAKARTSRNIKIGSGSRKTISKFVTIKDPHGDGVRAIAKDKTTTFLKVKKRESHLKMVSAHKEKKERGPQENAMAGKGTVDMLEEMIWIRRDRRGMTQLRVQTWTKELEATKGGVQSQFWARNAGPHGGSLATQFSRYLVIRKNLAAISHRILIDDIYGHQSIASSQNRPDCPLQGMLGLPTQIRSNKLLLHRLAAFLCLLDYRLIFPTQNRPNDTSSLRSWAPASVSEDIGV
ncbi:hypothetical protein HOY80DRAFT_1046688 [Tuber brumale]|nr:hypothetical protein HOY80DRAFT_1046688 [Tuber brumale]